MNSIIKEGTKHKFLQIHPKDNVLVALQNLNQGEQIDFGAGRLVLSTAVESKHKFTIEALGPLISVMHARHSFK
jgi:altronate hydrolase